MRLQATYRHGTEVAEFSKLTETVEPPADTSRDAAPLPEVGDPQYDLRMDARSVQHQLNVFFTEKMEQDKADKESKQ